jgi:hypothetical protein
MHRLLLLRLRLWLHWLLLHSAGRCDKPSTSACCTRGAHTRAELLLLPVLLLFLLLRLLLC